MAVMASVFDDTQRATLEALCDTFVPSVDTDTQDPVEREFLARSAGDLQVAAQIEGMLAEAMTPDEIAGVAGLLDALAEHDFASLPVEGRNELVHGTRAADPQAKLGLTQLKGLTMLLFYGAPDANTGLNPNWGRWATRGRTRPLLLRRKPPRRSRSQPSRASRPPSPATCAWWARAPAAP